MESQCLVFCYGILRESPLHQLPLILYFISVEDQNILRKILGSVFFLFLTWYPINCWVS